MDEFVNWDEELGIGDLMVELEVPVPCDDEE